MTAAPEKKAKETGHLELMDTWYPVQVKQNDKTARPDIDAFEAMMARAAVSKGVVVAVDFSRECLHRDRCVLS